MFDQLDILPENYNIPGSLGPYQKSGGEQDFSGLGNTPRIAITLGIKKIMEDKQFILMAWGEGKAKIIKTSDEGTVTNLVPASFFQEHNNPIFALVKEALSKLTRINTPWLAEKIDWTD